MLLPCFGSLQRSPTFTVTRVVCSISRVQHHWYKTSKTTARQENTRPITSNADTALDTQHLRSPAGQRAPPELVHAHALLVLVPGLMLVPEPGSVLHPVQRTSTVGEEGTQAAAQQVAVPAAELLFVVVAALVVVAVTVAGGGVGEDAES